MYQVVIENITNNAGKVLFVGESQKEARKVYHTACKIFSFVENVEDYEVWLKAPLHGDNQVCRGCLIRHSEQ